MASDDRGDPRRDDDSVSAQVLLYLLRDLDGVDDPEFFDVVLRGLPPGAQSPW